MEAALSEFISSVERALAALPSYSLGIVGTSFKTSPIASREKVAERVTLETIERLVSDDQGLAGSEIVLLATCNRIEIYYYGESARMKRAFRKLLNDESHMYEFEGNEAAKHLFRVAAGLDSLVIGETQILSQVKEASRQSSEGGLSAEVLARLFNRAYETAKKVREKNPSFAKGLNYSVSHAVLDLISDRFRTKKPNLMLIGSGKMIRLAIAALQRSQLGTIVVASRKTALENLKADSFVGIGDLASAIHDNQIDVVITATSAKEYVLSREQLEDIGHPLLVLDISVPRNVDPSAGEVPGITLMNLDDLKDKIHNPTSAVQLQKLNNELAVGVKEFSNWLLDYEQIAPLLSSLRKRAEAIRQEELENAFSRLPNMSSSQKHIIQKMSERMIRRFLHDPTIRLKQLSRLEGDERARLYAEVVAELFSTEGPKSTS
jgi:glutamyl-tRNA reductase